MKLLFSFLLLCTAILSNAQPVTEKTVQHFVDSYKGTGFKLYKIVKPKDHSPQIPFRLACLSGKEVLVLGIFTHEPKELDDRFIIYHISKKAGVLKRIPDIFNFQKTVYHENLKANYCLLQLLIPKEANNTNCDASIILHDKKDIKQMPYLVILTK